MTLNLVIFVLKRLHLVYISLISHYLKKLDILNLFVMYDLHILKFYKVFHYEVSIQYIDAFNDACTTYKNTIISPVFIH